MNATLRNIVPALLTVALVAATGVPAWAKPKIEVGIAASKNIVETVNGAQTIKKVPANSATSGDTVIYTVTYKNSGSEAATNAVINNPIAKGMSYIDNSVTGPGADISFSIDGGKTFKKPSFLTYEIKLPGGNAEKHTARPEEYTHIRWVIKTVPPGGSGTLTYQVKIK